MTEQTRSPVFVLLAHGPVTDPEPLRRRWDEWHEQVASPSSGWLGSTGGIAAGGRWLAAIRYSTEEAAHAAGDGCPPGPGFLSEAATVEVTGDVRLVTGNGSPAAGGFVQFMRARVPDRGRLEEVEDAMGDAFVALRRDFLGGVRAWTGVDRLTVVDWFTSEAEARAGEATDIPADVGALFGEWMSLLRDAEWYDLPQPWQPAP